MEYDTAPGGILADEMGLGKTVEILCCILLNPRDDISSPRAPVVASTAVWYYFAYCACSLPHQCSWCVYLVNCRSVVSVYLVNCTYFSGVCVVAVCVSG